MHAPAPSPSVATHIEPYLSFPSPIRQLIADGKICEAAQTLDPEIVRGQASFAPKEIQALLELLLLQPPASCSRAARFRRQHIGNLARWLSRQIDVDRVAIGTRVAEAGYDRTARRSFHIARNSHGVRDLLPQAPAAS